MAHVVWERFLSRCDMALDFHTSTRNRMTLFHARADMEDENVSMLATAFGPNLILSSKGSSGMLRRVASEHGIPTLTVEMGEANRFQPLLVDLALQGIENVLAAYDMYPETTAQEPEFVKVLTSDEEKRWTRADYGGLVEMRWGPYPIIDEGETICVVSDHFSNDEHVSAPFTGLLVGILANPRVLPGHPLVHLVELDEDLREQIERLAGEIGFVRHRTFHWMGRMRKTDADLRLAG